MVFLLASAAGQGEMVERVSGARVQLYQTEAALLQAWLAFMQQTDPDGLVFFEVGDRPDLPERCALSCMRLWAVPISGWFVREEASSACGGVQVKNSLGVLAERFKALGLDGGGLHISRLQRMRSRPVTLKRITMYSAAWVKSQVCTTVTPHVLQSCSSAMH